MAKGTRRILAVTHSTANHLRSQADSYRASLLERLPSFATMAAVNTERQAMMETNFPTLFKTELSQVLDTRLNEIRVRGPDTKGIRERGGG